jgi:hypothetical protein
MPGSSHVAMWFMARHPDDALSLHRLGECFR